SFNVGRSSFVRTPVVFLRDSGSQPALGRRFFCTFHRHPGAGWGPGGQMQRRKCGPGRRGGLPSDSASIVSMSGAPRSSERPSYFCEILGPSLRWDDGGFLHLSPSSRRRLGFRWADAKAEVRPLQDRGRPSDSASIVSMSGAPRSSERQSYFCEILGPSLRWDDGFFCTFHRHPGAGWGPGAQIEGRGANLLAAGS
ncbi:hypothetical protein ACVW0Y_004608, partial [Pseudomonas sp. TE3786]